MRKITTQKELNKMKDNGSTIVLKDKEGLYTTEITFGEDMFLFARKDNITNMWKQIIFDYDEWDEINELVNKHRKRK